MYHNLKAKQLKSGFAFLLNLSIHLNFTNQLARIFTFIFALFTLSGYCQTDTLVVKKQYELIDKEYFFQYCKNCKSEVNRPKMLCGHNYKLFTAGYAYNSKHWVDFGFSKDVASCFPERGGNMFSGSLVANVDEKLVNGIKFSYLRDHLLGLQLYFLKFGFNIEAYTDYETIDFNFRPEIRIADNMDSSGLLSKIHLAYGYNIDLTPERKLLANSHQISIILILKRKGWIS